MATPSFALNQLYFSVVQWERLEGYAVANLDSHVLTSLGEHTSNSAAGVQLGSTCYDLDDARRVCENAWDCHAITSSWELPSGNTSMCPGQYRVTYGTPTLVFDEDWAAMNLETYYLDRDSCVLGERQMT